MRDWMKRSRWLSRGGAVCALSVAMVTAGCGDDKDDKPVAKADATSDASADAGGSTDATTGSDAKDTNTNPDTAGTDATIDAAGTDVSGDVSPDSKEDASDVSGTDATPGPDTVPDVTPQPDVVPDTTPGPDTVPDVPPSPDSTPDVPPSPDVVQDTTPPLDTTPVPDVAQPDVVPDTTGQGGANFEKSYAVVSDDVNVSSPFAVAYDNTDFSIYLTAVDATGISLFKMSVLPAPTKPGIKKIATSGIAFVAPLGLALTDDGLTLFVADPAAGPTDGGSVLAVDSVGTIKVVQGTQGSWPRAVAVVGGKLYYSGTDLNGEATVWSIAQGGGTPTIVVQGKGLKDPSGLAVAADGTVYIADSTGGTGLSSAVFAFSGGALTKLADNLRIGFPGGIDLSQNEKALAVSGFAKAGHGAVHRIDLVSKALTTFTAGLTGVTEPAGLSRSTKGDTFVLADASAKVATVHILSK